jgi:hypothetical protein
MGMDGRRISDGTQTRVDISSVMTAGRSKFMCFDGNQYDWNFFVEQLELEIECPEAA